MSLSRIALQALELAVGREHVISDPRDLRIYERDGTVASGLPEVVVHPATTAEVAEVMRIASRHGIPIVARGAATGLSGGAVAEHGGISLSLSRMRRILEIDPLSRTALVEPGVVNADLSLYAATKGLFYAPDPSSQKACTLGGNAAENSGGPHCLFYGVTTNHVVELEVVLADGSVARLGGAAPDRFGLDLLGLVVGSEGTLAVTTQLRVRLLPIPESVVTLMAAFESIDAASQAVSDIIGRGVVPAALEMMDQVTLGAVEAHYRAGYPTDAAAVLLIDIEGVAESTSELAETVQVSLRQNEARDLRLAADLAERELLWAGRKGAIGALGRIKPNYYLHDGVVPRTKLPAVLREVGRIAADYRLPVANVFHAGDGNLHPNLLFDMREPGVLHQVERAAEDILRVCVEMGGTLSGEHGIGIEKRDFLPWVFSPDDIATMRSLKDAFDPDHRLNPGKVFPGPAGAHAPPRLRVRAGLAAEADWW